MTDAPAPEAAPEDEGPSSLEQLVELLEFFTPETIAQLANDRLFANQFEEIFPSYDQVWSRLLQNDPNDSVFETMGKAVRALADKYNAILEFADTFAERIARLHALKVMIEERALEEALEDFRRYADKIADEVIAMSDAEVDAYIEEHGLQELVAPERVEKLLREAMTAARRLPPEE